MRPAFDDLELICPHDAAVLQTEGSSLRCVAGHSFDVSRHGYLHLLPVAHKASRSPGDTQEMVAARRRVLDSGLFEPLVQALTSHARVAAVAAGGGTLLDAGCGDGHYLAALAHAWPAARLLGIDISKAAVQAAARRHRQLPWIVASNRSLPIAAGGADLILCLFGFASWVPWSVHQRAGQAVLSVDPGPDHLLELRQAIYPEVRRKAIGIDASATAAGYRLLDETRVTAQRDVPPIADLLEMTPHGRRVTGAAREQLVARPPARMTMDIVLREWQRDSDPPEEPAP